MERVAAISIIIVVALSGCGLSSSTLSRSSRQQNLAYMRPAYQSSSHPRYPASFANDGNANTFQHTADYGDIQPWWAVDLGNPTYVHHVDVLSRNEDCCRFRLNFFAVGLTSYLPSPESPQTYSYTLCGAWNGDATKGKMTINCNHIDERYKYVIVFGRQNVLNIAEVEVY